MTSENVYTEIVAERGAKVIPDLLRGNAGNVGEIGALLDLSADEIDRLRAELAEAKKEIALLKTPNLVWDFDDPENSAVDSVADAVYQHIDWWGDIHVGDVVTFLAARKLSNVTIRITSVNDDGEVTFEAIDAAMAGGEK